MLIERFKNIVKSNQEQNNKKTIENLVVFIIILIIVKSVYGTMIDKGVVKSIFERK